jgi:hypothetical protein
MLFFNPLTLALSRRERGLKPLLRKFWEAKATVCLGLFGQRPVSSQVNAQEEIRFSNGGSSWSFRFERNWVAVDAGQSRILATQDRGALLLQRLWEDREDLAMR